MESTGGLLGPLWITLAGSSRSLLAFWDETADHTSNLILFRYNILGGGAFVGSRPLTDGIGPQSSHLLGPTNSKHRILGIR